MKQKILIWILVAICLISSSMAVLNDAKYYYPMEEGSGTHTANYTNLNANLSYFVNTNWCQGIVGNYSLCGTNMKPGSVTHAISGLSGFTYNTWVKTNSTTEYQYVLSHPFPAYAICLLENDADLRCTISTGGGNKDVVLTNHIWGTDWFMMTWTVNSTNSSIYINGTYQGSVALSGGFTAGSDTLYIGAYDNDGDADDYGMRGNLDDFFVYNRRLTNEEILQLYNSGAGYNPYLSLSANLNLISPSDSATNNTENINFKYNYSYIENAECYLYTNETGSLIIEETNTTPIGNTTLNFNHVFAEGSYTWLIGCNTTNSTSRTIDITLTNITIRAKQLISNANLNSFNVSFDNGQNYATTNGVISFYTTAGNHSFNITADGHYDLNTQTINAVNGSTYTVNGLYSGKLNISAKYVNNATLISNFKAQVTSLNNSWSQNFTSIGQLVNATLIDGTYTVSILGYAQGTSQENITISSALQSLQIIVYQINSFNFTFLNEETEALITDAKIYIEFVGDTASYNFSTTDGTLYVDLITPSTYTLRYWANQSYGDRRNYIYTLTNATYQDLTLYLLSGTATDHADLTVTLYDAVSLTLIENAVIYLQRYYIDDNSYKTVAMYETDTSGKAYFEVQQGQELYKFIIAYPFGTTKLTTEPLYIQASNLNLYVNLLGSVGDEFFNAKTIQAQITHNNATRQFTVTYTDSEAVASQYCLYIKENALYSKTIHNSSCITSSSGTITLTHPTTAGNYYAVFTAVIEGEETTIKTGWINYLSEKLNAGSFGIFMSVVIVIIFAFLSQFSPLAPILAGAGLMFGKMLGLIPIAWGYVIMVFISSIILIIVIEILKK